MRSRCSVYVDAGYLLASAATRVAGTSLRKSIHVQFATLVEALVREAEQRSGIPVLRVHWYDSARNGVPDFQQERIGELAKVKLRLGRFGREGEQKGVDLRIGLDLVAHARNGAAETFFLVSGDDDLTEAVEEAQAHGVQVIVLAVPNLDDHPHGISRHLVRASDGLEVLPGRVIDDCVLKAEVPPVESVSPTPSPPHTQPTVTPAATATSGVTPAVTPAVMPAVVPPGGVRPVPSPREVAAKARPLTEPTSVLAYRATTGAASHVSPGYERVEDHYEQIDEVVAKVVSAFRKSATPEVMDDLEHGRPSIPRDLDRALLFDASEALGIFDLSESVRHRLRTRFWEINDQVE